MYSKDDLLSKDMPELLGIANDLDADFKSDDSKDTIIYAILDKQGEIEGKNSTAASSKRKRVRIVKKDTDRVYSVSGKEGENFDLKKSKPVQEPLPLFADEPPVAEVAEPVAAPKKRGRKSKAEKEAIEAAARAAEAAARAVELLTSIVGEIDIFVET